MATLALLTDSGLEGDNITNVKTNSFSLTGFDPAAGSIKYTLWSANNKVIGKADTSLTVSNAGEFSLPVKGGFKDGTYKLTVKQGSVEATLSSFTVDTKPPADLKASLVFDTGKSNKDKITSDLTVKLDGVETGATLEFRFKKGSESSMDDNSEWFTLEDSLVTRSGKVAIVDLNQFDGWDGYAGADGWKDKLEFRQTDVAGNKSKKTASLDVTYDPLEASIVDVITPEDGILNGKVGIVTVIVDEELLGLSAADFQLSGDTDLFSFASTKEIKGKKYYDADLEETLWKYELGVKAAKAGEGEVELSFASGAAATDIAGNAIDFSTWEDTYALWIA